MDTEPRWYVVHTRARSEKAAASLMGRGGIETFLPTVTRLQQWKDRRKEVDFPLFPGYCFSRIRWSEHFEVVRCSLVVGIVSVSGRPVPVGEDEIESIRRLVESRVPCDAAPPVFEEGDRVRVVRGPLQGVVGRLLRTGKNARLELAVAAINQAVRVEVDAADTERC
jgi:transcription antitermination factor NusG